MTDFERALIYLALFIGSEAMGALAAGEGGWRVLWLVLAIWWGSHAVFYLLRDGICEVLDLRSEWRHRPRGSAPAPAPGRLVLTVEVPGFHVEVGESSEDVEVAMGLLTEQVALVFASEEDGVALRPMEGRILEYEVRP